MELLKFSVIVPIYNLENYLTECIESILKQRFSDYELILINDGSTDKSSEICNYYSSKYSHIKTINKKNTGVSDTRNIGINFAKGEYVIFVDGDDYINSNSLEKIYNNIKENGDADIIFLEGVKFYNNGKKVLINDGYDIRKINFKEKYEVLNHISILNKFPASPCTKAVKRNFLIDKGIYFQKGLQFEDIDWSLELYIEAEKYLYCSHIHYFYRQNRSGSETDSFSEKRFLDLLYIFNKWVIKGEYNKLKKESKKLIYSTLAYEYIFLLWGYSLLPSHKKKIYKSNVKNFRWILNFRNDVRTNIIKFVCNIVGINMTAKISLIYFRLKQI